MVRGWCGWGSLYVRPSLPPAGRNPQKLKVLNLSSLCGRPSLPPAGRNPQKLRNICIGSEQSTCPSSQHSICLASQQGRGLGSQEGTCLTSQHQDMPSVHSHHKGNHKGGRPKAAPRLWRRPKAASFCVGCEDWAYLSVETAFCEVFNVFSAHLSPLIPESTVFEISDVLFCAQEHQSS